MYELYLNGNKVKQINYIGEHDYTPVVEQVETPMLTYNTDNRYGEEDCNYNRYTGYTYVDITCETSGATIYYRYGLCTVDEYCNPTTVPDLTNEPWVLGDFFNIYNTGTNTCDDGSQQWYVEYYAAKSGMEDSGVMSDLITVYADECIDCNDCSNYEALGYPSYEECDCAVNVNSCPEDCSDWENLGYGSYEECDCAVNGNCEETDCNDCSNWEECGYESYEDCDCQVNGNCETDCTDCNNWEECGYTSWDDCSITNDGIFPSPEISGGIDANVSGTTSNIVLMVTDVENLEWKVDYGYSMVQNYVTNWTAGSYVSGSGANSLYNYTRSNPWTDVDGYAHIKVTMRRDGVESETHQYKFNNVRIIEITE